MQSLMDMLIERLVGNVIEEMDGCRELKVPDEGTNEESMLIHDVQAALRTIIEKYKA